MLADYLVMVACGTGAAAFAAFVRDRRDAVALLAGWLPVVGLALAERSFSGAAIGTFGALCAAVLVARPERRKLAAAGAGVLAGLGAGYAAADGVPIGFAAGAFALVPVLAAVLVSRRAPFAPARLREEALLAVLSLAALAAAVPIVSEGWRAAAALRASAGAAADAPAAPAWTLWAAAAALCAGGLVSFGRRR